MSGTFEDKAKEKILELVIARRDAVLKKVPGARCYMDIKTSEIELTIRDPEDKKIIAQEHYLFKH